MKILVSGSHGFVGKKLCAHLKGLGHEVYSLSRRKGEANGVYWNPKTADFSLEEFEGFDGIIHLAGKNIASGLWTRKRKNEIFLSRARDSWLLTQILHRLENPPKTLICASAVGIYGDRGDEILTETSPPGEGYLAKVCTEWEKATSSIEKKGVRVVHTRFGIILSPKGGMLKRLLPLFHLGLGAILGKGTQYVPWIALEDVMAAMVFAMEKEELKGPINFVSPNPVTQETFSKTIAKSLQKPLFLRVPQWLLKFLLGEMAEEMFLASTRAIPQKLIDSGYSFVCQELSKQRFS